MPPIALSDSQLRELMQAAQLVPLDLRNAFLQQVAARLRGKDLGDGLVHRVAYEVDQCDDPDHKRVCARGDRSPQVNSHAGDAHADRNSLAFCRTSKAISLSFSQTAGRNILI